MCHKGVGAKPFTTPAYDIHTRSESASKVYQSYTGVKRKRKAKQTILKLAALCRSGDEWLAVSLRRIALEASSQW